MPETTVADAREAFEDWARSRGMYAARREGEYPNSATRFAWGAWIASWRAALTKQELQERQP